jgi:hypothetical protein
MLKVLRRIGLARLIRIGLILTIPPFWYEIAVLHYRGSFQNRFMWGPVLSLPAVLGSTVASALKKDERRSRDTLRPFAWLMTLLGMVGTFFHLRGIARQMGGFSNWKYNIVTGPPFPAPMQIALFGYLGSLASRPISSGPFRSRHKEEQKLVRSARWINSLSCMLLAIEAGYNHWSGNFFNRLMYTPLLVGPLQALIHLAALMHSRLARMIELPLSAFSSVAGLVGYGFHLRNVFRRPGGLNWQNLFYGPPTVAALQMTAQGIIGLLIALFSEEK